ncbi:MULTISPECIES: type II secretion system protein GspM [unclassified Pseudomonas]|uniref:type II secretion system protein GspM n=1 Tax=unclassified Pseudomonas TaxID=196821 RepID=UPI002A36B267|nr:MULTISPECIES: type II secretion system protein GspM [unclassified Pseudomonas]MDX9669579.1 type II secretion system protein GspM [Pseudomonas sp. P8_250]WPN36385.1 type II secretion system protein GspM [Pseudomonas sp. P8_139]WPN41814.1 type II secretion system protein GspM [Pseudomonas sp. P8_229]
MPRPLSAREQRSTAIALAVLTLIGVYFLGIHWWFTAPLMAIADEMHTLRISQQQYQALQAQRPVIDAQLAEATSAPQNNEYLLSDSDTGAATAQLMQLASSRLQAVSSSGGGGCSITNKMPVTANETGLYKQVKVSINLNCSIQPLAAFVYNLENERVSIFIETLSLRRSPLQSPKQSYRLTAQMLVSAYTRNNPKAKAE